MADKNLVEQKPVQADPVEQIATDAGLPAQPEPVAPSVPEKQKETEVAREFNSKIKSKQDEMKRNFGKEIPFAEAQHSVIMDIKQQKDKEAQEAAKLAEQQQVDEQKRLEQFNNALNQYEESKAFALEQGLPFKEDADFENALSQRQEQANMQRPATEVDVEVAQTPTVQDVKDANEDVRKQNALQQAKERDFQVKREELTNRHKKIQEEIEREDMELKKIDPNRYWNNRTTGQKIMAGIGLVLAGIGSGATGQKNAALQVIENAINDDLKSQKLNNDQIIAKKKHALNIVEMELKKLDSATNNKLKKVQIMKLIDDMQKNQMKLAQAQITAKKLASPEGLTREEVFGLDDKMQKKMVMLSDGKFRPAVNAELAKKLNMETIPQSKDAIRGLTRLREILDVPAAELTPTLRAESQTIKQALKGALRLELFGPGVMTDFESRMADKIIGDPTKILTMDSMERAKFDALLTKVKQGTIDKIRQSGVAIPETKNEKMLKQFMSKNPTIKRPEAINALIKLGYWDESADVGF